MSARQGTHWEGCWRAHHECAVSLLDKILREATVGYDQARHLLNEARCDLNRGLDDPRQGELAGKAPEPHVPPAAPESANTSPLPGTRVTQPANPSHAPHSNNVGHSEAT